MMEGKDWVGVGIIGAGGRGIYCVGTRIAELSPEVRMRVVAVCDRNPTRMAEGRDHLVAQFGERGVKTEIALYPDYRELIADPNVRLIMVSTPSDAHREPAIEAMRSGKAVYLDKPIAANVEDAIAIVEEERRVEKPLMMGFSRRYEPAWRRARKLLAEGVIGELQMMQIRAIIPYHRYLQRWHRRRAWSGGALNDKSSHHYDVLNWFAASVCTQICAFGGRSDVFKPDPKAPLRCSECDRDCPYRVRGVRPSMDEIFVRGRSWLDETEEQHRIDTCVYQPGADIHDHVAAILAYENGVKASLFYAIFGPGSGNGETLELVGSRGRMILTRKAAAIDLVTDYGERREVIDCKGPEHQTSHYGADREMVRRMRRFFDGEAPTVGAPEGYASTRMIMATHRSIDNGGETVHMTDMPAADI